MGLQLLFFLLPLLPLVHSNLEYKINPILDPKKPWKQRIWSSTKTGFQLADAGDVLELELRSEEVQAPGFMDLSKNRPRRKRQDHLNEPKLLELAVFIDEALWRRFVFKYGQKEAKNRMRMFAVGTVNQTRSLFQHPRLSPRLDISMVHFEIWKNQPLKQIIDMEKYLDEFCSFIRQERTGFDHATLISGQRQAFGGSFLNSICLPNSCSIVRANYDSLSGYRLHGQMLAHELGHSLGMHYDEDRGCNSSCCIMATRHKWGRQTTRWSKCSQEDYQRKLATLPRQNCLNDRSTTADPVNNGQLLGQTFPDEAQCHQHLGSCFRTVPGHQSDCRRLHCSRDLGSDQLTTMSKYKLNGTYCGPNKICDSGACIRASSVQMEAVHGGWSSWSWDVEGLCGNGNCSQCRIRNQRSFRMEVRRCDAPYPNNGGRPCPGTQIRGVQCHPSACRPGSSLSKEDYIRSICRDSSSNRMRQEWLGCGFHCSGRFSSRHWFPDGTECNSFVFGSGWCVQGVCMHSRCRNTDYFVPTELDCP